MCEVHNKDLFFDLQQDAVFERERKETNERMSPSVPSGSRVQEGGGTTFPAIARAGGKDSHENGLEAAGPGHPRPPAHTTEMMMMVKKKKKKKKGGKIRKNGRKGQIVLGTLTPIGQLEEEESARLHRIKDRRKKHVAARARVKAKINASRLRAVAVSQHREMVRLKHMTKRDEIEAAQKKIKDDSRAATRAAALEKLKVLEVTRIEKILRRAEAQKLRLEELDARRRVMRKQQDRARLVADKKLEELQEKLVAGVVADTLAREFDAMGLARQYAEIQDTAAIKIRDTDEEVKKTYARIHLERKQMKAKAAQARSRREPIERAKADLAQTQRRRQKLRNIARHREERKATRDVGRGAPAPRRPYAGTGARFTRGSSQQQNNKRPKISDLLETGVEQPNFPAIGYAQQRQLVRERAQRRRELEARQQQKQHQASQLFQQMDLNGDGHVDQTEFEQAVQDEIIPNSLPPFQSIAQHGNDLLEHNQHMQHVMDGGAGSQSTWQQQCVVSFDGSESLARPLTPRHETTRIRTTRHQTTLHHRALPPGPPPAFGAPPPRPGGFPPPGPAPSGPPPLRGPVPGGNLPPGPVPVGGLPPGPAPTFGPPTSNNFGPSPSQFGLPPPVSSLPPPGAPPPHPEDGLALMEMGMFDNDGGMGLQVGFVPYGPPGGLLPPPPPPPPPKQEVQPEQQLESSFKPIQYQVWPASDEVQQHERPVDHEHHENYHHHQQQGQQQQEGQQQQQQPVEQQERRLPPENWFYIDLDGHKQGPFEREEMRAWFEDEYFTPDLMIACSLDGADPNTLQFSKLEAVFPGEAFL